MQESELQPKHVQESDPKVQDGNAHLNEWKIRNVDSSDLSFIYATWLNSMQSDSLLGKSVRRSIFMTEQIKLIDSILENDATHILVACSHEDSSVIFGYAVLEKDQLHYIYVKEDFRRQGIGYSLVFQQKSVPLFYTHQTSMGKKVLKHLDERIRYARVVPQYFTLQYNPFLLNRRDFLSYDD